MERDVRSPLPLLDVVPPIPWSTARQVAGTGAGLVAVAAVLGLVATVLGDNTPWAIHTVRLLLVFAGSVVTGIAVSIRPDLVRLWALGAGVALLAWVGTPAHWDSFRLLFAILAVVALARTGLLLLPTQWRIAAVSGFLVFHFLGIFMATTSPPPTPWLTEQVYHRFYNQYLQFTYLRNAYHFYSPEPGPSAILACLVRTEVPGQTEETEDKQVRKKYDRKWVVLPRRPQDIKDPLGLTYYRRLCLTDQISRRSGEALSTTTFEKNEVMARRQNRTVGNPPIPFDPNTAVILQYRLPTPEVTRFLLPSYAKHLIWEETPNAETAARTTIRLYRLEHRALGVGELVGFSNASGKPGDPYHPVTYRPTFLGEFNALGQLVNPKDDMLYWLLPVLPRQEGTSPPPGNDSTQDYVDYMSVHADGFKFDWSQLR